MNTHSLLSPSGYAQESQNYATKILGRGLRVKRRDHDKSYVKTLLITLFTVLFFLPAHAGIIRDTEIENYVRALSNPIFEAADLPPESIDIVLIGDKSINAFVAGGANIFIHTGLLLASESPEMLLGVMAHETGHIAGGHLPRGMEQLERAQYGAIISYILGAAAAASGAGDVGSAIMSGGSEVATRSLLAYTRANEQSADQAGLEYLDANHLTSQGMLEMFEVLRRNEKRQFTNPDPYTRSHPLSQQRVSHIRNHLKQSPHAQSRVSPELQIMHQRMLGKLEGFIGNADYVLAKYPANDTSIKARYARSVALYRLSRLDDTLAELEAMLTENPNDPYLIELKGQYLFENGRIDGARQAYKTASTLLPNAPLIRTDYAKTLIATGKPDDLRIAIGQLERSAAQDKLYSLTWRLLASAYGKTGQKGKSHLALAEEAAIKDDTTATLVQSELALEKLDEGSPSYLRAQDLKEHAERRKEEEKDE